MTIGVCTLVLGAFAAAQYAEWDAVMRRAEQADEAGNYEAAIASYRKATAMADRFGPKDARTWSTYNRLGMAYQNAGMAAESIRCYRREITMIRNAVGPQSEAYSVAIANLATTLVSTGDPVGGGELLREALRLETGVLHANSSTLAITQIRLVEALMARGRDAEAERLLAKALPAVRASGEKFYLAVALNALGVLRRDQHRAGEALDAFQEVVALTEAEYGADHPILVLPLNNLGAVYSLLGNFREAERVFLRAVALCDRALPPDHPSRATVLANYADCLARSGEKSRGRAMRRQAEALIRDNARRNGVGLTVDVTAFR